VRRRWWRSTFLGANADGRLLRGVTGPSLVSLTAAAKRRLLATALEDARRVPLPVRTRGHVLGLFVSLTLPAGRFVMSVPGFAVGAIFRDGRSLAVLGPTALAAFGDDRAAELLLRRVEDWDRRGRPRESDLSFSVSFGGNDSRVRRRWAPLA
jgi:hypothetical protein